MPLAVFMKRCLTAVHVPGRQKSECCQYFPLDVSVVDHRSRVKHNKGIYKVTSAATMADLQFTLHI